MAIDCSFHRIDRSTRGEPPGRAPERDRQLLQLHIPFVGVEEHRALHARLPQLTRFELHVEPEPVARFRDGPMRLLDRLTCDVQKRSRALDARLRAGRGSDLES